MPRYNVPVKAGEAQRFPVRGRCLQIVGLGGAASVALELEWNDDKQSTETIGGVSEKFKLYSADRVFSAVTLTASVDATIDVLIAMVDLSVNPNEGANVTAVIDTAGGPVAVAINSMPDVVIDTSGGAVAVQVQPFAEGGDRADLAVSTVSARVAVGGAGSVVRVTNETDDVGLVKFGGNTVTAADPDAMTVMPQSERIFAWPTGATDAAGRVRAGTGGNFSFQRGTGA